MRTVNGKVIPVGEDRPKKGRGGPAAVAIVLGVSLGAGGLSVEVSAGDASSASRSSGQAGKASDRGGAVRVQLRVDAERTARMVLRLRRRGLRVNYTDQLDTNCAAHAHGQVAQFLREHPCVAMYRTLLVITERGQGTVLMAVARVQMLDETTATALKELLDRPGSGNIIELSRDRGPYRGIRFTGQFYRSNLAGTVVTNAQAQPVLPGAAGRLVTKLVNDGLE